MARELQRRSWSMIRRRRRRGERSNRKCPSRARIRWRMWCCWRRNDLQGQAGTAGASVSLGNYYTSSTYLSDYSVESPSNLATACLARVGAHAALSFTFSFLKRAWHSGEESDLCVEVLQDALVTMQALPVAILFDVSSISPIWLEVVDRTMKFLITMQKGWVCD